MSTLTGFDAELDPVIVFDEGQEGYHTIRVPALVCTKESVLLAFAEGRRDSHKDDGHIEMILRRSRDLGRTWGNIDVLATEEGDVTMGNPCPIVEHESGDVILLYTRNNGRAFCLRSTDGGETFGSPKEITDACRGFDYPWVRVATGPVHGIQLSSGRIVMPSWLGAKEIHHPESVYRSCTLLSDDGGYTWRAGAVVGDDVTSPNECTAYERSDGTVVLNMRMRSEHVCRLVAESADGGETFSEPRLEEGLPAPQCQGATLPLPEMEGKKRLLFSDIVPPPPGGNDRKGLTVRMSCDEGASWPVARCVTEDFSGYADMTLLPDGSVGMLCECGSRRYNQTLAFVRFTPQWIEAGARC